MRFPTRIVPAPLRALGRRLLGRRLPDSPVAQEWEWYARDHTRRGPSGGFLGDEWNAPDVIGVDVPPERIVEHLDERVFAPFLGSTGTLLEIGAGGGRFTAILLRHARRLIAADTSPTMLKLLRRRFAQEPRVEYLQVDGTGRIPLAEGSVDAAFSYDVFVHLRHWEIYLYLVELRRLLRAGGRAVIHHANTFSDLGWRRSLADAAAVRRGERPKAAFSVMTPELMGERSRRAGLAVHRFVTDAVRRDCITLLLAPEAGGSGPPAQHPPLDSAPT